MKKLFLILLSLTCYSLSAQLFPIMGADYLNTKEKSGFLPLNLKDTLFVEDLIGEGQENPPKVLQCFVFKMSEWNYIISYKLIDCEKTYLIKDGYIGPIYIYKNNEVTVLTEN